MSFGENPLRPHAHRVVRIFARGLSQLFPVHAKEQGDRLGRGLGAGVPNRSTFRVKVVRFLFLLKERPALQDHAGAASEVGPVERLPLLDLHDAQGVPLRLEHHPGVALDHSEAEFCGGGVKLADRPHIGHHYRPVP